MTEHEYRQFCISALDDELTIQKICNEKSLDEFDSWYKEIFNTYHELVMPVIHELKISDNETITKYRTIYVSVFRERFANIDCIQKKTKELGEFLKQKQIEKFNTIVVGDKTYKAIDGCDVLWSGWECDDSAWVVEENNQKRLVASNHGSLYFEDAQFLENKIKEYHDAITNSIRLLRLLAF